MMIDCIEKQLQCQYAVFMMFHYPSETADIMKLTIKLYHIVVRT